MLRRIPKHGYGGGKSPAFFRKKPFVRATVLHSASYNKYSYPLSNSLHVRICMSCKSQGCIKSLDVIAGVPNRAFHLNNKMQTHMIDARVDANGAGICKEQTDLQLHDFRGTVFGWTNVLKRPRFPTLKTSEKNPLPRRSR